MIQRLFLVVLALVATYPATGRFVLHGPVDQASLVRSVTNQTDGDIEAKSSNCVSTTAVAWTCTIAFVEGNSAGVYDVQMKDGGSCWTARVSGGSKPPEMPTTADGCVYRWQWSLKDLE